MGTQPYRTRDGQRVPSVTTITGRFKQSDGLMWWANRLALDPLMQARHLIELAVNSGTDDERLSWDVDARAFLGLDPKAWDYKLAREKAADAGTIAHEMVDSFIHKQPFDQAKYPADLVELAIPAYEAFRQWADQSKLEIVETEKPLVSEKYRFGGTRDAILIQGKRCLGDWKTSNQIYPEYLLQLAAYGILDEEHGATIDGGYHLLKFSKQEKPSDPVRFAHFWWDKLDAARRGFLLLREAYEVMKELEKQAK